MSTTRWVAGLLSAVLGLGTVACAQTPSPNPTGTSMASTAVYIVTLRPGAADVAGQARDLVAAAGGGRVLHVYQSALRGFSAELTPAAAQRLRRDPAVQAVEADAPVHTQPR